MNKTPTVAALFEPSVNIDVEYKGISIKLEARPSGFTGKLIAQINEIQNIKDDELYANALANVAAIVDGLIVRWDLKQNGTDNLPLVFAPGTKQRAQIVGLYPEYLKECDRLRAEHEEATRAYNAQLMDALKTEEERAALVKPEPLELPAPDDADRVESDEVPAEEWASYPRTGPGLLYVLDDPADHTAVRGVKKDTYLPVSDVAALKMVPLVKNVASVQSLPLPFMQFLMGRIMEEGAPKA